MRGMRALARAHGTSDEELFRAQADRQMHERCSRMKYIFPRLELSVHPRVTLSGINHARKQQAISLPRVFARTLEYPNDQGIRNQQTDSPP